MTDFTPGPWEALHWEREKGGLDWNVWGPKSTNHIANDDLRGDFGSEADAHLIAAAPCLYEALHNALVLVKIHTGPDDAIANATLDAGYAALSKARGEKQ